MPPRIEIYAGFELRGIPQSGGGWCVEINPVGGGGKPVKTERYCSEDGAFAVARQMIDRGVVGNPSAANRQCKPQPLLSRKRRQHSSNNVSALAWRHLLFTLQADLDEPAVEEGAAGRPEHLSIIRIEAMRP